jgi:hypothetical protein
MQPVRLGTLMITSWQNESNCCLGLSNDGKNPVVQTLQPTGNPVWDVFVFASDDGDQYGFYFNIPNQSQGIQTASGTRTLAIGPQTDVSTYLFIPIWGSQNAFIFNKDLTQSGQYLMTAASWTAGAAISIQTPDGSPDPHMLWQLQQPT